MRVLAVMLALCASLAAGCHSTQESWHPEIQVEETSLGPPRCEGQTAGGNLRLRLFETVREVSTPVLRLYLTHEFLESTINWEDVGLGFLYVVGGVVVVTVYLGLWVLAYGSEGEHGP